MELRIRLFIYVDIVIATLIAYEPIRHNDFISYDDPHYITENPDIQAGLTLQSFGRAFIQPHFYMWHPLTTITHLLNCKLFGLNPVSHHLISVLLHITAALLLFWILADMTKAVWPSAFTAAVFALHPVQVESVAWAAELKTILSGLFWILTIAAYIRYAKKPSAGRYLLLLLVFGICILTKPVVVTLPFVLLLLDYWPLDRVKWAGRDNNVSKLIVEKIPLFALSAILVVITFSMQKHGGAVATLEQWPLDYRIANVFIAYIRYIGKFIWPSRLAVFYPPPPANFPKAIAEMCALFFILITALCLFIGRRKKYIAVGWLLFAGTLVPMIGIVQSGDQAMANRYMYISILGLLIIVVWTVKDLVDNRPHWKMVLAVSAGVVLSLAIILTRAQVRHWQNSVTLYGYTLKVTENNATVENNYGYALLGAGRLDEAVLHLNKAIRLRPTFYEAHSNLGLVLMKQGKTDEAIARFNRFLQLKPRSSEGYANLGLAYSQQGKYRQAIQNWAEAVELKPDNTDFLNNLAWLLATVGDASVQDANKAIELAQRACELAKYKDAAPLDTLAAAYAAAGRFNDAITTAEQAVSIAKAHGQENENAVSEIQDRIKLYKTGQPYVQK